MVDVNWLRNLIRVNHIISLAWPIRRLVHPEEGKRNSNSSDILSSAFPNNSLKYNRCVSLYPNIRQSCPFTKMKINSTNVWTVRGSAIALLSNTHSDTQKDTHIHTRADTLSTESIVQVDGLFILTPSRTLMRRQYFCLFCFFVFSH